MYCNNSLIEKPVLIVFILFRNFFIGQVNCHANLEDKLIFILVLFILWHNLISISLFSVYIIFPLAKI